MKQLTVLLGVALILGNVPARPQTKVDLKNQTKTVDFTNSIFTRPLKTGSTLPATCTTGDMFFRLAVTPGSNLYACTSTNTWTQLANSGSVPLPGGLAGQVLGTDGAAVGWRNLAAGVSGSLKTTLGTTDYTIDADTTVLARKASSEQVTGLWNFDPGVALTPRTTPTSPADGQIWYDSGTQRFRCQQNGGTVDCVSGIAANDPTAAQWNEEFCGGVDPGGNGTIGALGWRGSTTGTGAALSASLDSDANHPCVFQLSSGTTSGGGSSIFLGQPSGYQSMQGWSGQEFELQFVFRLDSTFTNQVFRAGLADVAASANPANRIGVRVTGGVDAQYMFEACSAGTCATPASSGVTVDASWHRVRVFRKAGDNVNTIRYCLDGCSSSQQILTNVPATAMSIVSSMYNPAGGSSSSTLKLDWFSGYLKGISRW